MNSLFLRNIIRFILLMLIQVLILNSMNLSGYLNPYLYVLFVLLLPVKINKSLLLILAFLTGLTVDFFGNTIGLHAAATVLLAFFRPGLINLMFKNIDFDDREELSLKRIGIRGFLSYSFILILIHHWCLFSLEAFTFRDFHLTMFKVLLSTLLSTLLVFITMMLFSRRKS